jgi:hypothetical protein
MRVAFLTAIRKTTKKARSKARRQSPHEDQDEDQSWRRCLGHLVLKLLPRASALARAVLGNAERESGKNLNSKEIEMRTKTRVRAGGGLWGG